MFATVGERLVERAPPWDVRGLHPRDGNQRQRSAPLARRRGAAANQRLVASEAVRRRRAGAVQAAYARASAAQRVDAASSDVRSPCSTSRLAARSSASVGERDVLASARAPAGGGTRPSQAGGALPVRPTSSGRSVHEHDDRSPRTPSRCHGCRAQRPQQRSWRQLPRRSRRSARGRPVTERGDQLGHARGHGVAQRERTRARGRMHAVSSVEVRCARARSPAPRAVLEPAPRHGPRGARSAAAGAPTRSARRRSAGGRGARVPGAAARRAGAAGAGGRGGGGGATATGASPQLQCRDELLAPQQAVPRHTGLGRQLMEIGKRPALGSSSPAGNVGRGGSTAGSSSATTGCRAGSSVAPGGAGLCRRRLLRNQLTKPLDELGPGLPVRLEALAARLRERVREHLPEDLRGHGRDLAAEPRGCDHVLRVADRGRDAPAAVAPPGRQRLDDLGHEPRPESTEMSSRRPMKQET